MIGVIAVALEPGTVIADKVRLIKLIGQGGMGSVWTADHLFLDTHVAIKFMTAQHASNPEAVERFKREAAAAAKIKSPHVVQVLDYGVTSDGLPFIVMELLEGEDLGRRIVRTGPLPIPVVADVVAQVCKALGRAHSLGIVHRDIKPENIFLSELDGERLVKVLDFGIAKRAEAESLSMTSTGVALGSPYYMSPEQVLSAKQVDHRSDLWSLGIVAYQALTGRVPFEGETSGALAVAINEGRYDAPSVVRTGIPFLVDEWFRRVLVKDPEARFASAREMSTALSRAAGIEVEPATGQTDAVADDISGVGRVSLAGSPDRSGPNAALGGEPISGVSPALARTYAPATLSGRRPKSKMRTRDLALGIGLAFMLFSTAIVGAVLIAHRSTTTEPRADSTAPTQPVVGAALPAPSIVVVPAPVDTSVPVEPPAPSASAATPPPAPIKRRVPRAPAPPTTGKKPTKDRGF